MRERSTRLAGEGSAVAAAEQQEGLGEVDRPLVDGVQAFDELAPARVGSLRATSSSVCEIASGVRSSWEAFAANLCCSATWDSSCVEHRVERVGEFAEFVLAALHADPVGQRPGPRPSVPHR